MWISDSHTGDYHDNTNGKMCLKLITTKVILLAARTYPGVQMVLVIYNAPYHHVRGIPSFTSFSNKSTSNLRKEHGINYVTLRWPMSKSVSYPSSKIIPSTTATFKLLLTNKSYREEKPNKTLSKIHQTKNSGSPPSFGWSDTIPKSFAARWRSQSRVLVVRSSGHHPTVWNSIQLSCTGQQEKRMFPVPNTSAAVSNTQFPTWGTAGMVTLITLPVGKWVYVSLRMKIPIF